VPLSLAEAAFAGLTAGRLGLVDFLVREGIAGEDIANVLMRTYLRASLERIL